MPFNNTIVNAFVYLYYILSQLYHLCDIKSVESLISHSLSFSYISHKDFHPQPNSIPFTRSYIYIQAATY